MKLPEVRIKFSSLLYETVSKQLVKLHEGDLSTQDECRKWAEAYQKEWSKYESKLLTAMQDILGLEFYKSVIDVTLAPLIIPMSDPIIIHFRSTPDEFVDVLTHELLHVLLTDNTVVSVSDNEGSYQLGDTWEELFGHGDDLNALVHIPVHAVHKKIYLEVLKDESRLKRDVGLSGKYNSEAYAKAWKYVDEQGADSIVEKLKESYKKIAAELGVKS